VLRSPDFLSRAAMACTGGPTPRLKLPPSLHQCRPRVVLWFRSLCFTADCHITLVLTRTHLATAVQLHTSYCTGTPGASIAAHPCRRKPNPSCTTPCPLLQRPQHVHMLHSTPASTHIQAEEPLDGTHLQLTDTPPPPTHTPPPPTSQAITPLGALQAHSQRVGPT
jgi:hypothetical protein